MPIQTVNPANHQTLKTYHTHTDAQVDHILHQTTQAQSDWQDTDFATRSKMLRALASHLREQVASYADLITQEMGKPIVQSRNEIEKCAWVCEYYAQQGEAILQPQTIATDAHRSFVCFEPLGVVLAIMPWNFPFWQVIRAGAPTLFAGNGMVLKHASQVSGCALAIENAFAAAGFPEHLSRTVLVEHDQAESLIADSRISAVTLTGSVGAGRKIASKAGQHLKKCVLELGGADPYVILEDADVERAVSRCVQSRLINSGQSCIAAKRFIVTAKHAPLFLDTLLSQLQSQVLGDPMDEQTTVGPMARAELRDDLHEQVQRAIDQGAVCRLGGVIPQGVGSYYPVTVLTDVQPGMSAFDEELFGPVFALVTVQDDQDAIKMANHSHFGLGTALFSQDVDRAQHLAQSSINAGSVFVNDFVKSDPRLPFGGIKDSGYGRELGAFGLLEFVNIKTVVVNA